MPRSDAARMSAALILSVGTASAAWAAPAIDLSGNVRVRLDAIENQARAGFRPAGLYNAMGRTNVLSPGVRLELAPSKRLDGFFAVRDYWLSSRTDAFSTSGVRDPSGRAGRHAGVQFDTRVRWWAIPDVIRLEANGVYFAKGAFYRRAPNAPRSGDTRYMSLNASVFF